MRGDLSEKAFFNRDFPIRKPASLFFLSSKWNWGRTLNIFAENL